jgi:putative cell wall-binding protein
MIVGIAHAPAAGATDDVTSERLAGQTRYGTAAAISADEAFEGATTAILATGENFPDALAASGLAGDNAAAPILLTPTDELSDETLAALDDLAIDEVTVVGGTAAVSDDVVTELEENGYAVNRVAGENRYETAAAIAGEMDTVGEIDGLTTALIATGENYPDALAGGPAAYAGGLPILLVTRDGVPAATEAAIDDLGIEQAVVLGGTAAVSEDTRSDLAEQTGNDVVVVAGENRYGTAAEVGDYEITELAFGGPEYLLASGENFPDALAGGPLGGELTAPIILTATDSLPDESAAFLDEHSDIFSIQIVLGGTAAVSEEAEAAGEAAAENTATDTPTGGDIVTSAIDAPELQSASISGIDIDDLALVYSFTFDEDVDEDTVDPGGFHLYGPDNRNAALGDVYNGGDDIDIDGEVVAVTFNLFDYGAAVATLAGVDEGAVEDSDGNINPPQTVETAGVVNSVGSGFLAVEITDEDDGIAEFTFSTPQLPGTLTGTVGSTVFQLIERDGTLHEVTGGTTSPDEDEFSTVVEVDFNEDLSDLTLRRAVVTSASFARINTVDIGSGTTDGPDLVSISTASDDEDLGDNEVLFTFDEAIDTAGASPSSFDLIYAGCNPAGTFTLNTFADPDQDGEGFDDAIDLGDTCSVPAVGVDLDEDTFGNRAVVATFASDLIDNDFLVAGQVDEDAGVTDEDAETNRNDEAEYSTADDLFDDGQVAGPQLIGATLDTDTTVLGDFDSYILTLTFDKDLDDDPGLTGDIKFWWMDGDDVNSDTLEDCEIDDDTTVVCTVDDEESDLANASIISVDDGTVTGADEFALDTDELDVQFTNPEASIEVDLASD